MRMTDDAYNARLFTGGLRKAVHTARFKWVDSTLRRLQCTPESIIEVGCLDGKVLNFLPQAPNRYLGLDVSRERISASRQLWRDYSFAEFRVCSRPDEMELGNEKFEVALCMETLEHVPPDLMEPYIEALFTAATRYVLVTVPNEKGPVFLLKHLYKLLLRKEPRKYTVSDIINSFLGRMHKVSREEHRGFDYAVVARRMAKSGHIVRMCGIPFPFLPVSLNTQVGIVGIPRQ
jgi:SAM-dependent methyltransferase